MSLGIGQILDDKVVITVHVGITAHAATTAGIESVVGNKEGNRGVYALRADEETALQGIGMLVGFAVG